MKRLNKDEWTDGKDIYTGSPQTGFVIKESIRIVELEQGVDLKPAPIAIKVNIKFDE